MSDALKNGSEADVHGACMRAFNESATMWNTARTAGTGRPMPEIGGDAGRSDGVQHEKTWDSTDDEGSEGKTRARAKGSASVEAKWKAEEATKARLRPPSRRSWGGDSDTPQRGQHVAPLRYPEREDASGDELIRLIDEVAEQNKAINHGEKMMHMVARGHSFAVRLYAAQRSGLWRMCTIVPRNWSGAEEGAGTGLTLRFRCGTKKRNVARGRVQAYDARLANQEHTMDKVHGAAATAGGQTADGTLGVARSRKHSREGVQAPHQHAGAPATGAADAIT